MLVSALFRMSLQLAQQRAFLKKNISPVLHEAKLENDGSLTGADFKKITHYYGWAVPAVLGEAFCSWRGKPMTDRERRCATAQGAMTGLFDDLFDQTMLTDEAIEALISESSGSNYRNTHEKLFHRFFREAFTFAPDQKLMRDTLYTVYEDQVLSRRQAGPPISADDITDISFRKGGSSLLFYRTAFDPPADALEKKILYALGGLMQLSNDLFDIYKDRQSGIQTLPTTVTDMSMVKNLFEEKLRECQRLIVSAGVPETCKQKFYANINLGIFSRAWVCLDQLMALQKSNGDVFDLHAYPREALICDMEKWSNLVKSAKAFGILRLDFGR